MRLLLNLKAKTKEIDDDNVEDDEDDNNFIERMLRISLSFTLFHYFTLTIFVQ